MFGQEIKEGELVNFPTSLEDLRIILGEVAILPSDEKSVIKADVVKNNHWVFVQVEKEPEFNPMEKQIRLLPPVKIKGRWLQNHELIDLSKVEKAALKEEYVNKYIKSIIDRLMDHMEKKANELGYGNSKISGYLSICSYNNSTNAKYRKEARSFERWRDNIWTKCEEIKLDVLNGLIEMPDYETLLTLLPEFELIEGI